MGGVTAFLLGLLPDLLQWAPHILGGLGGAAGLAGLFTNLRTYALIGLAAVTAGAIGYGLLERGNYQAEKAERIADAAAAAKAASDKIAEAKKEADKREAKLQAEIAANRATADIYREMIANAPPSSYPPSAAARAASRGLSVLLAEPGPARSPPAK